MAVIIGSTKTIDNRDDRKEIRIALEKMQPEARIKFLKWALALAPINLGSRGQNPLRATDRSDNRTNPFPWGSVEQVYFDLMMAISQYAVPSDVVVIELERRAAKKLVGLSSCDGY